jgi:hypothetical protein
LKELPNQIDGLEVQGTLIGRGTHSKVILGQYFLTPVAIKEYHDSEAFMREHRFYKRAQKLGSHHSLLSVMGAL